MTIHSHIEPGSWRIATEATEARMSIGRRRERGLPLDVTGAFYLRPSGALAGFTLLLSPPGHPGGPPERTGGSPARPDGSSARPGGAPELRWEAADLDREGQAWLRFGEQETRSAVSVLDAEIPGEHPYLKIVLETEFSSRRLRLPGLPRLWPRRVTVTLFSEIRPLEGAPLDGAPPA
ncbi:hypothetical protein [Nonomuraea candida]|uniref:hypothetical protein n=1 Tax=Nonomuraea candida TaxID=359159 RepID=UPI0005B841EA|nr:hypothetical protein [Nonomuraea candida]